MRVLVHLPGGTSGSSSIGVTQQSEILGIQGKRRTTQKRITPGTGAGGLQLHMGYRCYTYSGVDSGFAERDLDEYDGIADGVALSRSLYTIRRAFGAEVELERVWETVSDASWLKPSGKKVIESVTLEPEPYILHGPTLAGGVGASDIKKFYDGYFMPADVEARAKIDQEIVLLSRTIGTDSIVDELHVSFTHAVQMEWLLPGIPPTNKDVDIVVVCIVSLRSGKLWAERLYWDQASVLVQVGLLNPQAVPGFLKKKGVRKLPAFGQESAAKVFDMVTKGEAIDDGKAPPVEELNTLMKNWKVETNGQHAK